MTTTRLPILAATLGLLAATTVRVEAGPHNGCGFAECGTNSGTIRGNVINGLDLNGAFNADGMRVVPNSLTLNPSHVTTPQTCWGYTGGGFALAVQGGALMGMTARGISIPTECLVGGTFAMEIPSVDSPVKVTLKIAVHNKVSTWHQIAHATMLDTYELIDVGKNVSVCERTEGWMETWQTGGLSAPDYPNPPGVEGERWHDRTDHALIVQGESYTPKASIDPQHSGPTWFNIACAGSALAKSRLMGYDPMTTTTTANQRQSTLKMLTAHYVHDNAMSWTQSGTPLVWEANPPTAYYGWADPSLPRGPLEAYWDENGATCVSHLRLWNHTNTPNLPSEADTRATIWQLGGLGTCVKQPANLLWTTTTVDHID